MSAQPVSTRQISDAAVQVADTRPETLAQGELQETANNSPQVLQMKAYQAMADTWPGGSEATSIQTGENRVPAREKVNNTGLPDTLKSGIEQLSGYSMDAVRVHYNSEKPAQLQAFAYAQGTDIHVAPGQERHLPHEAWHVVQQAQGRVQPTLQLKGMQINDDTGLEAQADAMGQKALQVRSNPAADAFTPAQHTTAQQGVVQCALKDDRDRVEEARTVMLSTRQPLSDEFTAYGNSIKNYKPGKAHSPYRENSSKGLLHWAEHLNIAGTGALAELKRVQHEGGMTLTPTGIGTWSRRSRLGVDTKTEPDVITSYKETGGGGGKETWAEEIKGVTSSDYSAVGANIKKAIEQLDKPRAAGMDYHRVVIYINNPDNSWPWTSAANAQSGHTNLGQEAEKRLTGFEHNQDKNYKIRVNGITNYDAHGNMSGKPGSWSFWGDVTTSKKKVSRKLGNTDQVESKSKKQKLMTYEQPQSPTHTLNW